MYVQVEESVKEAVGTMLNKVEIAVNFFQVYALLVVLSFDLDFPQLWDVIRKLYNWIPNVLSISFSGIFTAIHFNLPHDYQEVGTPYAIQAVGGMPCVCADRCKYVDAQ